MTMLNSSVHTCKQDCVSKFVKRIIVSFENSVYTTCTCTSTCVTVAHVTWKKDYIALAGTASGLKDLLGVVSAAKLWPPC